MRRIKDSYLKKTYGRKQLKCIVKLIGLFQLCLHDAISIFIHRGNFMCKDIFIVLSLYLLLRPRVLYEQINADICAIIRIFYQDIIMQVWLDVF